MNEVKEFEVIYKCKVTQEIPSVAINFYTDYVGELIRCKECKYYDGYYCHNKWYGNGYGSYPPPIKTEDGFCDLADRKE